MPPSIYMITATIPTTYLNRAGQAITGYNVYFDLLEFNENHYVQVPNLDPKIVDAAVKVVYNNRAALSKLGQ